MATSSLLRPNPPRLLALVHQTFLALVLPPPPPLSHRLVKDLLMMDDYGQVKQVISALERDFTLSSNPNSRKGGLVGLAATAIALGRVSSYMDVIP